ncbi:hypothetical protein N8230_04380 [Gammaproteobacteria bacterium]|nr:hypothetical protein [Gammaproteobacteria bacterium]
MHKDIAKIKTELDKHASKLDLSKRYDYEFHSCADHSLSFGSMAYRSKLSGYTKEVHRLFNEIFNILEVEQKLQGMYSGDILNTSENRAALHSQYRLGEKNLPDKDFVKKILDKAGITSFKNFKNLVTFGIGGSFEGPKLLIEFMSKGTDAPDSYFVTGPDPIEFEQVVKPLINEDTFYIFSSKSFSTEETLQSLALIREHLNEKNCLAITANPDQALKLGFDKSCIIEFPEEVGGRYSIWSPISAPSIIYCNKSTNITQGEFPNNLQWDEFIGGGAETDSRLLNIQDGHTNYLEFIKTLSFSDLWHSNFLGKENRVVLSYSWQLRSFANYVQQLEMESLGKNASENSVFKKTGQNIFGGYGPTAQHSYFQLLHQGTSNSCADFVSTTNNGLLQWSQEKSQIDLFTDGHFNNELKEIERVNSNIPSNVFKVDGIAGLGFLLASWEHRTFISAAMLEINPFDQFGVSAGKIVSKKYFLEHGD